MGRIKKKPGYNAAQIDQKLLDAVAASYAEILKRNERSVSPLSVESFKLIEMVAKDHNISPMKMRKLLITAGVYRNEISELIEDIGACHRELFVNIC